MKIRCVIALIATALTISVCGVCFAAFQPESHITLYRGAEWHYDIEDKEGGAITILPKDRKEPQAHGSGIVGIVEPYQKKYDIIFLK